MSALNVILVPQLRDNYSYIVICDATKEAAIVDCPEAAPMIAKLEELDVTPVAILNTHHHWDHISGNTELLARWPQMQLYGHSSDKGRITGMTHPLEEGDTVKVGNHTAEVIFTPGHTSGHIAYWFAEAKQLFVGDTLFYAGCGRIFEGTAEEMYSSAMKLAQLDPKATVYCGHEYTQSNIRFALSVEPDNEVLQALAKEVEQKRANGEPTIPYTLEQDLAVNPFLRVAEEALRQAAKAHDADLSNPASVFGTLREMKNNF